MSRIDKIRAYKINQEILRNNVEIEKEKKTQALIKQVQALRPRIVELLSTANACAENGIELNAYRKSFYRHYDTRENGTFVTNGISHKVGFISPHLTEQRFKYLGIEAGGACGNLDFRTDGVKVFSAEEGNYSKVSAPLIHYMERFLKEFDDFETDFYNYVDGIIDKVQSIEPVTLTEFNTPNIEEGRLKILLYNAISCLEERGCDGAQLEADIGINEGEYAIVMGELTSLDKQIQKATSQKTDAQFVNKKDLDNNLEL